MLIFICRYDADREEGGKPTEVNKIIFKNLSETNPYFQLLMYAEIPVLKNEHCKKWFADLNTDFTKYLSKNVMKENCDLFELKKTAARLKTLISALDYLKEGGMGVRVIQVDH